MNEVPRTLIILGSGPAGLSAAIYAARANLKPLVIDGPLPGGQLMHTNQVENWPGTPSILGHELMGNMREHAHRFGTEFLGHLVARVDLTTHPSQVWTHRDLQLSAHALIIAAGSTSRTLGCPGEQEYWAKGVSTCAVCDGALYQQQPVVIVGGGSSAVSNALFMSRFTNDIIIVQATGKLTAQPVLQAQLAQHPHIKIMYESTVEHITGDGMRVTGARIHNKKTGEITDIATRAIFVSIGLRANTDLFKGHVDMRPDGTIIVDEPSTRTSVEGVFAAGDVADGHYRQAITAAASGCKAALDAQEYLMNLSL